MSSAPPRAITISGIEAVSRLRTFALRSALLGGCRREEVAYVAGADDPADVAAAADRGLRPHVLAFAAADPRPLGRPVVRLLLRNSLDGGHPRPPHATTSRRPVPRDRSRSSPR